MTSGRKLLSRLGRGSCSQEGVPAGSTRFLSFGCGLPPNPIRHPWKHVRGSEFCVRFIEIYLASTRRRPSFNGHARSQTLAMGQAAIKRGAIVAGIKITGSLRPGENKGLTIVTRLRSAVLNLWAADHWWAAD